MTYTITTDVGFSAAHYLRGYAGACSKLHGHNWRVEVSVSTSALDDNGFAVDFLALDEILKGVAAPFDHEELNSVFPFDSVNPTAENMASHFMNTVNAQMKKCNPDAFVSEVIVWETDGYRASVKP